MVSVSVVSLRQKGFTIVELLIVIVVVAILAAISVVAYSGVQQRARDSQRVNDVKIITKALEMYYIDNGAYPAGSGSTTINGAWSTTVDPASWQNLRAALVPGYLTDLPTDPSNITGRDPRVVDNYGYAYYSNTSSYCGVSGRQMYILTYRLEGAPQTDTLIGDCPTNTLRYSPASNYRVVK